MTGSGRGNPNREVRDLLRCLSPAQSRAQPNQNAPSSRTGISVGPMVRAGPRAYVGAASVDMRAIKWRSGIYLRRIVLRRASRAEQVKLEKTTHFRLALSKQKRPDGSKTTRFTIDVINKEPKKVLYFLFLLCFFYWNGLIFSPHWSPKMKTFIFTEELENF